MPLSAGDILHIFCTFIEPQNNKFAVCFCPEKPLFFFINTKPFVLAMDAQILIKPEDYGFLDHDSYINTASPITFSQHFISGAGRRGAINANTRNAIKSIVQSHNHLSQRHVALVVNNL
jgi:hypothetical protein